MKTSIIFSFLTVLAVTGFALAAETGGIVTGDPAMPGRKVMQEVDNSAAMRQVENQPMHGHTGNHAEFNRDYMRAMNTMHKPMMDGIMANDPDVAFVKGMIPHHEGAVEMAKIQLKYGKDPELRKLAEDIIAAQDREIIFMNEWLKKNPDKVAK